MNFYALILVIVCCVAWMTRPGQRPQVVVLDMLPWLCVAGFLAYEGALGVVLAWAAVPLIYFSIRYNQVESLATPAQEDGTTLVSEEGPTADEYAVMLALAILVSLMVIDAVRAAQ